MQNDHPVMDGVSNFHLPEPVIHTIFSFLSLEDAIRASVLSKQWRSAWISSPIFSFDEGTLPFKNSDFIDYVDRSLALWRDRCDGMLNMEKLSLSAAINDGESFSRLVQVFAFATSHNVKAIELKNCAGILWIISDLNALWPLLCACKSLDVLSLELFILFLLNSLPKTSCLRKLTLTCIKIDDNSLCNLLASFPFLEDLAIEYCYGFTELNVSLSNLRKLKMISYDNLASKVVIEAENLQSFYYDRCFNCPGTITFSNSKSLTSLHIEQCKFLTASALDEIISRIPIRENLTLEWCVWPDVIRITHSNLKSLRLPEGLGDGKAEINTPNLRFFSYSGAMDLFSTFRYSSGILNANLVFGTRNTEWFWYIKLRNFLECFSECNMVKLTCYLEGFPEELRDHDLLPDPFYEMRHLDITNFRLPIMNYASFVCAMVQLFPCLETLSLKTFVAEIFIEFDEDGDASVDWQEFLNTEESEDVDRISQSIDAAMDEIMELLNQTNGMEKDTPS